MEAGCKIRLEHEYGGTDDYVVEVFRHCLGVFLSPAHREAGDFTPLCELYGKGPESEEGYVGNHGAYWTNMVPAWMDIPRD